MKIYYGYEKSICEIDDFLNSNSNRIQKSDRYVKDITHLLEYARSLEREREKEEKSYNTNIFYNPETIIKELRELKDSILNEFKEYLNDENPFANYIDISTISDDNQKALLQKISNIITEYCNRPAVC